MSTQTAPSKEQIAALTGSDLDQAISDAEIDASTGGSTTSGALSAQEKRDALVAHYYEGEPGEQPVTDTPPDTPAPPEASRTDPDEGEPQPKSVEEQREEQLKAGQVTGKAKAHAQKLAKGTPAEQRSGILGTKPIEGRVDNMTRRDDSDVLQGHFCVIDFDDDEFGDDARKAVEAMIGEGNAKRGFGDYGVYIEPGSLDEKGYPLTATVMLRDEHSCLVSSVPYGALRPIPGQGGRR